MRRLISHIIIFIVASVFVFNQSQAYVSNGEKANATTFNNSFMSREIDTDTIGNLTIKQNKELRLEDSAGGEYVSLKAPSTLLTTLGFVLPGLDGNPTDILQTDGSGNLSFVLKPTSFDYVASGDGNIVTSSTTSGTQLFETSVNIDGSNNITGVNEFNSNSFFDMGEVTTPSNPVTTRHKLYFKNTGSLYILDEFGTELEVRAGPVDLTSQVSGILPIANGGTNSSTALLNNLVMISSGDAIVESATTDTELSYLNNVTSDIQGQIDGKEPTLTKGDLTESISSVLSITGGTGSVIGSGTSIEVSQATTSTDGYLSSADWNTFNGKEDAITILPIAKGGTGSSTQNFVDLTTAQVIAGVKNFSNELMLDHITTPTNPAAGKVKIYAKSDDKIYKLNSAGTEVEIGTGGGGGGGLDPWITATAYAVDDIVWYNGLIYQAQTAHTSDTTFEADYLLGYWVEMNTSVPLLGKGSLLTSDGLDNGEFTACADGETIVWDSSQINGFKCSPLATEAITNWSDCTSSGSWVTNVTYTSKCRRVGQNLEVHVNISLTGGTDATQLDIDLPSDYCGGGQCTMDTTSMVAPTYPITPLNATGLLHDNGTSTEQASARFRTSTSLTVITDRTGLSATITNTTPFTFASGDDVDIIYSVPIAGWSSNNSVVAFECDGLGCVNEFSLKVSSTNVITDENVDWATTSTFDGTFMTVNFQPGVFTSSLPNCQVTPGSGYTGNVFGMIESITTSYIRVAMDQDAGSSTNFGFNLNCQRSGDFREYNERFLPVTDKENIFSALIGNGTVSKENLDWVSSVVPGGSVVTINFTPGRFTQPPNVLAFTSTNSTNNLYVSSLSATQMVIGANRSTDGIAINIDFPFYVMVQKAPGDYVEPKAFVGNVDPDNFVQSGSAVKPRFYSARILTTGTVDMETGNLFDGNCTNADTMVCPFPAGTWSTTPICQVTTDHFSYRCSVTAYSASSISIICRDFNGGGTTTDINKFVHCHGVQ